MENYANYPVILNEVRSKASEHRKPRDVLIEMLRRIDAGEKLDTLIICYSKAEDDGMSAYGWSTASPSADATIALLERVKFCYLAG